ncbi:hypothetical protein GBF35_03045 [Nonomuraea phyllanthi]|uniref:hypothetical protein n=1 Tax=Nonomuraea phyllanthi TaxID=2219224 RepID=UPI00129375EC|nr:hypothetical protein [Nonomuraea phyllanthi]QFY05780.1 hypothetical protein GBF35_03045 [Nonomuraea phyllanthi]
MAITPGSPDNQQVDHVSLRAASEDFQAATDHLETLVRQTFATIHRHGAEEAKELAPEFDAEHADLARVAPQAYASLLARLRNTAGGVRAHSATHETAEHANGEAVREI